MKKGSVPPRSFLREICTKKPVAYKRAGQCRSELSEINGTGVQQNV